MRAELPWNVAGIPPEAREAARAAARREGLSVGEWLTRRILRSFSGTEDASTVLSLEDRVASGAPLDSWGLPASAASRRDSEEMLARVGRSENESNEAWRRIEEQLKGLGRRLDFNERSHSESNRVLSRTAQEMNISTREQAQAFEQLGKNILGLHQRLERLERSTLSDSLREAVKALHQGLSRLADQITSTANNSAGQLVQVTANLEKLASQVGQIWEDADKADQLLNRRIDIAEQELDQRIQESERALEARLSQAEKMAQFNTNALDHALEKIETAAGQRAADLAEYQKRATQHDETLHRLEDGFAQLETRLAGTELEERVEDIAHTVSGLSERLEQSDPALKFDGSLQALSHRLEALEKEHADLVTELHARLLRLQEAHEGAAEASPHEEPSLFAEPALGYEPAHEPPAFEPPPEAFPHHSDEADAFAPAQDFALESPPDHNPDHHEENFTSEFAGMFEEAAEPENFLAQARRSARAASDKAEDERRGRLSGFRWSPSTAEAEEKPRPRYLIPLIVVLVVALAAAAALILSQRARTPEPAPKPVTSVAPVPPAPSISHDSELMTPPQTVDQPGALPDAGNAENLNAQPSEPASEPLPPVPAPQRTVGNAPVTPVATAPKKAPSASLDRVIQMVNAGNPTALAIMGLRALDGTNGAPVNLPDAVKFLTQAAEKGQAVAQYRLGTLYERGQGVPADAAKAAHWYEMAANQGNRKAMHNLAVAYAGGASGKKDMAEAARWFAKAASLGLSDSQFNLAVLYERGDGVPQSLVDAYKWYAIAAATGDAEAKARIGVLQSQLGDADKAAASRAAAAFQVTPLNRSANVPPEPADLG